LCRRRFRRLQRAGDARQLSARQQTLTLREIHRFTNSLQKVDGFDCWDLDSLEGEIRRGLEKVCEQGILIDSIGIDTWGVDYVLLDKQGQRVGLPVSYRDSAPRA
jgi:rhamnulokinase